MGLKEEDVGDEPRVEPCRSILVIGLVQCEPDEPTFTRTQTRVSAGCLIIALTGPMCPVIYNACQ